MDNMDLFSYMREKSSDVAEKESPLAARMRPTTLDEVVGQHLVEPSNPLSGSIPKPLCIPSVM